jgi:hypothetical protein
LRLAAVLIFYTAAPVAGDIGSCGQSPDDLDPVKYFTVKELLDCKKCLECSLASDICKVACKPVTDSNDLNDAAFLPAECATCSQAELPTNACKLACAGGIQQTEFPKDCYPVVHDGEACLNALTASGCNDYRLYMSDVEPTIPTECNFCPPCDDGGLPDGSPVLPKCE